MEICRHPSRTWCTDSRHARGKKRCGSLTPYGYVEGGGVSTTPGCAVHALDVRSALAKLTRILTRFKGTYLRWRGFLISSFSKSDALSPCCLIFFRSVYLPKFGNQERAARGGGDYWSSKLGYELQIMLSRDRVCFENLRARCSHSPVRLEVRPKCFQSEIEQPVHDAVRVAVPSSHAERS